MFKKDGKSEQIGIPMTSDEVKNKYKKKDNDKKENDKKENDEK